MTTEQMQELLAVTTVEVVSLTVRANRAYLVYEAAQKMGLEPETTEEEGNVTLTFVKPD